MNLQGLPPEAFLYRSKCMCKYDHMKNKTRKLIYICERCRLMQDKTKVLGTISTYN